MAGCEHNSCGGQEKVWLPYFYGGRERGLKPHPYCANCGLVKNLSSDRPHAIGFYMNVIASLSKHYKISKVQIRLMVKEMEKLKLCDNYGMDKRQQERLFVEIAKRALNVPERAIRELL